MHHTGTVKDLDFWYLYNILACDGALDDATRTEGLSIDGVSDIAPELSQTLCCDTAVFLSILKAETFELINAKPDGQPPEDDDATSSIVPGNELGPKLFGLVPEIVRLGLQRKEDASARWPTRYALSDDELLMQLVMYAFTGSLMANYLPFWLVVAVQASMDIHDIFKGKTNNGMRTLQSTIGATTRSVDVAAELIFDETEERRGPWFHRHEWFTSQFASHEDAQMPGITLESATSILAQTLPSVPAVADFHLRNNALGLGVTIFNMGFATMTMALLYKAAHYYGLISTAWEDLDFVLANFVAFQPDSSSVLPIVTKVNPRADAYAMARKFPHGFGLTSSATRTTCSPEPLLFEAASIQLPQAQAQVCHGQCASPCALCKPG